MTSSVHINSEKTQFLNVRASHLKMWIENNDSRHEWGDTGMFTCISMIHARE